MAAEISDGDEHYANCRFVVAVLFRCLLFTAKVTCGNFVYRCEFSKLS